VIIDTVGQKIIITTGLGCHSLHQSDRFILGRCKPCSRSRRQTSCWSVWKTLNCQQLMSFSQWRLRHRGH